MMYDLFVFSNHTSYIINHKFEIYGNEKIGSWPRIGCFDNDG